MSSVTYVATRSLIAGHTLNVNYSLDLCLAAAEPFRDGRRSDQVALSGMRETLYWYHRAGYDLTLGHYAEVSSENLAVLEFLDSVAGGESFTFDMWGSVGAPDNPVTAIATRLYSVNRAVRKPGGKADLLTYSMPIEVIPE